MINLYRSTILLLAGGINGALLVSLIAHYPEPWEQVLWPYVRFFLQPLGQESLSHEAAVILLATGVMLALLVLALSPLAEVLMRWQMGMGCSCPEEERLHRNFQEVCRLLGKDAEKFHLGVIDSAELNAYAMGQRTVAATRGLLQQSDREIQGVLAHELGHLHYGDTIYLLIYGTLSQVGQICLRMYWLASRICGMLAVIPILGFVFLLFNWVLSLLIVLFQYLLQLPLQVGELFGGRQMEYRADAFAVRAGCGQGLYDFLNALGDEAEKKGFGLYATHPPTVKRMRRIEAMLAKNSISS